MKKKTVIENLDAELLLSHVLKKPREWILARPEYRVSKFASLQVCKLINKRAAGVPLAYLTGHKEFFGLDFFVNKNVLIPRPETETLVSLALDRLRTSDYGLRTIVIDIGTGSGCIPIAVACHCERPQGAKQSPSLLGLLRRFAPRNDIKIFATDISRSALTLARRNAKKHGVKIKFLHGNLLSPLLKNFPISQFPNFSIIITANLPYLTEKQFTSEPSIRHEPRLALVAGKDGLKYYKKLLSQIKLLITNYQLLITIFLEINPSQTSSIKKLIKKNLPQAKIIIHKDLSRRNRVVEIQI